MNRARGKHGEVVASLWLDNDDQWICTLDFADHVLGTFDAMEREQAEARIAEMFGPVPVVWPVFGVFSALRLDATEAV